ncbi:hypothetical protein ACWDUN_02315 [Mycobacterium sp. NPDC003323]
MEPLKVDAELLQAAGERLLSAAQGLPGELEPFTVAAGPDELSQTLAMEIPKAENPIIEGLPPMKRNAISTAESVVEAARRYAQTDALLRSRIEKATPPPAGGSPASGGGAPASGGGVPASGGAPAGGGGAIPAGGAPAAPAASGVPAAAAGAGGMGGMLGMPMQMAQQAGQIPQQVAGMAGSLPQSVMQGAQQVGEQVTQLVEQVTESAKADDTGPAADGSGERAPVDEAQPGSQRDSTINL